MSDRDEGHPLTRRQLHEMPDRAMDPPTDLYAWEPLNEAERSLERAHMSYDDVSEARNKVSDLKAALEKLHDRDPDQEIWEFAYRPIDAALEQAAQYVGDDPVVAQIRELISPETVLEGRDIRVADVLTVVYQLDGILERRLHELRMSEPRATRRRGGP